MNNSCNEVNLPDVALLAITRVALGVCTGLLAAGWALLTIGIVTTVPIAVEALGRRTPRRTLGAKRSNAKGA